MCMKICGVRQVYLSRRKNSGKRDDISEQEKVSYCSVQDEVRQEPQFLLDFHSSCCSQCVDEDEGVGLDEG